MRRTFRGIRRLLRPVSAARTQLSRRWRHSDPGIERLEDRRVLSTTMAGGMAQGNLYGDQSVVVALPISAAAKPTRVQVIDTGDIGMGQQSVREFVPFSGYRGTISLAAGDFLHKGYQQLIVSTTGQSVAKVAIFDLFQTFAEDRAATTTGVFTSPVVLHTFKPFPRFIGGAVVATGDFDGDGMDDMAVGTGRGSAKVNVYTVTVPNDAATAPTTQKVASFLPFGAGFTGGLSVAAGHFSGASQADLIVGTGACGGSKVLAFSGNEILHGSGARTPLASYRAFGTQKAPAQAPVQVELIESIVQPEAGAVTDLGPNGLTPFFTPSNNAPLARGTIVAYDPRANSRGHVSLYSLVSGSPVTSTITLPSQLKNGQGRYNVHLTSVGYMFDDAIKDSLAPMVLVANSDQSDISLVPLSGTTVAPVPKIFTDSPAFPFGLDVKVSLSHPVKVLESGLATHVAGGTSGMLPCRQVAFRSPFPLQLNDGDNLLQRYGDGFFANPLNQSATTPSDWYANPSADSYGPSLAAYGDNPTFPAMQSTDGRLWRNSMIAAGLQLMNRGFSYQHHHFQAWFGPNSVQPDAGPIIAAYPDYSYTPPGMQTPGVDCSDYSAIVVNMVTGQKIEPGIASQATVDQGTTQWSSTFQGTSNIYVNNDVKQGILSWYTLALYYEQHGAAATYKMLNDTLQTGDLLYYGDPRGTVDPHQPLTIDKAAHVTIWTGQSMPVPGTNGTVAVPLLMDSHGGNIQTAVDANNTPTGVVEPDGPQIRPFFVPNTDKADPNATYEDLKTFMTSSQSASQNYYYFGSFTHAIRINFPVTST